MYELANVRNGRCKGRRCIKRRTQRRRNVYICSKLVESPEMLKQTLPIVKVIRRSRGFRDSPCEDVDGTKRIFSFIGAPIVYYVSALGPFTMYSSTVGMLFYFGTSRKKH